MFRPAGDRHDDRVEGMDDDPIMEEYEGPYGTVVGRRTPSIASHWSGSSRSLEDMDGEHHHHHHYHHHHYSSRSRQTSATQFPTHQTTTTVAPPASVITTTQISSPPCGLEESKGMTSSAEELSTTLISSYQTSKHKKQGRSGWVPIDVASYEGSFVPLERPEPTKNTGQEEVSAWGKPSCKETLSLTLNTKGGKDSKSAIEAVGMGTSEDDAWGSTEVKKERKKKKKKPKNGGGESCHSKTNDELSGQQSASFDSGVPSDSLKENILHISTDHFENDPVNVVDRPSTDSLLSVSSDHFQDMSAKDQEPATLNVSLCIDENETTGVTGKGSFDAHGNLDSLLPAITSTSALDNLDDFELQAEDDQEENGNTTRRRIAAPMLSSVHSEDELAKALEEARSDDDTHAVATPPTARRAPKVSENFPYRVSSSEDDEDRGARHAEWSALENLTTTMAKVAAESSKASDQSSLPEDISTDDRGETSGEDRRLGAEPNVAVAKSKKKKKKRR